MEPMLFDEGHVPLIGSQFSKFTPNHCFKKGERLPHMRAMSLTLPMCSVDFMDTSLSMEEQAVSDRIQELKAQLGDDLLILGHHYQRDSIVMHADFLGDSFMLSQQAASSTAKHIVFCASISWPNQQIF